MIRSEYLETIFIAKKAPDGGWPDRFAVATACNPFSNGDRADDAAHQKCGTPRLKHAHRYGAMGRYTPPGVDWRAQQEADPSSANA